MEILLEERHQGDFYSGSCRDLRQDLQEMIAGGHFVEQKLLRRLHSKGHRNVKKSAKRNIREWKTRPHPLAKHGCTGKTTSSLTHTSSSVAKLLCKLTMQS